MDPGEKRLPHVGGGMPRSEEASVVEWLLEFQNPIVRYNTLLDLIGRDHNHPDVVHACELVSRDPFVLSILAKQKEQTFWESRDDCYTPTFTATVWRLLVLADLGLTVEERRVKNACEFFLDLHRMNDGGFATWPTTSGKAKSHVCLTGNMTWALLRFGYADDARVWRAVDWLLARQMDDGGWNCYDRQNPTHSSFSSTIQPLWALSKIPSEKETSRIKDAVDRAIEFFLAHRLYKSHRTLAVVDDEMTRLHYPFHYCYDVLHGLRVMSELGVKDERLNDALKLLASKRMPDGKWILEGVWEADEENILRTGWSKNGHTLHLEEAGVPSKWITLKALLVLK